MSVATEELVTLMDMRARTYGLLARLYREEIDKEELEQLQGMRFPVATGSEEVDKGYKLLYEYLKTAWDDSITELAIDYVHTFIGYGVNGYSAAYPFESVYTSERRLMMQEARAEVLQVMRENKLKAGVWNEGEDHIGLEMEFMQRMSMRCSEDLKAGDQDACLEKLKTQLDFAQNHIANWLPMLVADIEKFSRTKFYKGLGHLSLGFVEQDIETLTELIEGAKE